MFGRHVCHIFLGLLTWWVELMWTTLIIWYVSAERCRGLRRNEVGWRIKRGEDKVACRQMVVKEEENGFMLSQQLKNTMLGPSFKKIIWWVSLNNKKIPVWEATSHYVTTKTKWIPALMGEMGKNSTSRYRMVCGFNQVCVFCCKWTKHEKPLIAPYITQVLYPSLTLALID